MIPQETTINPALYESKLVNAQNLPFLAFPLCLMPLTEQSGLNTGSVTSLR